MGTAAVALAPDPFQHPDQNLVLYSTVLSQSKLQKQLQAANITTPINSLQAPYVTHAFPGERYARHQHLWADTNGIHAVGSNRVLRPTGFTANPQYGFFACMPVGWTSNDAAVVYALRVRYLIEYWRLPLAPADYLPVLQPVLLLQAP